METQNQKSKSYFLWMTLILPLLWLLADLPFGWESVKAFTVPWKKIEILFYESKKDLLGVYRTNLEEHKKNGHRRGIVLGSSRSGEFSPHTISDKIPGLKTYNFSAPLAGPAFHYYWLEQVYDVDPELSLVILETDPVMFSKSSLSYTLNYSLDIDFVWKHSDFFPIRYRDPWEVEGRNGFHWDEVETWATKNVFSSFKYPVDPGAIKDNRNSTFMMVGNNVVSVSGREYKARFQDTVREANRLEYGAIPNQILHHGDENFLRKDAVNMASQYFGNKFSPSLTQILFFKKSLEFLAQKNIPTILYWPLVSDYFRKEMDDRGLTLEYKNHVLQTIADLKNRYPNYRIEILDLHEDKRLQCRAFVDSVHLSGACYPELFGFFSELGM